MNVVPAKNKSRLHDFVYRLMKQELMHYFAGYMFYILLIEREILHLFYFQFHSVRFE